MKKREGKGAPTDLIVCFPTRAHLTLMPKAICSPIGASGLNKNPRHLRKSSIGGGGGHGNQYKTKQMDSEYSEPTSPKVGCAGQISVRPRAGPCKSWQSVMEEIEKIHNNKLKKRSSWAEALGFLTYLRSFKLDFRCFGSFPNANVTSDDDDDEEDDHQYAPQKLDDQEGSQKAVFSRWFTVLQENQKPGIEKQSNCKGSRERESSVIGDDPPSGPPPNALSLMRSRSAPAKCWQGEKEEEEECENEDEKIEEAKDMMKSDQELEQKLDLDLQEEEEKKKNREILEQLMRYESDFYKLSSDIVKETWVVGGHKDKFLRSRSTKK